MSWAALAPLALLLFALCERAETVIRMPVVEVGGAAFKVDVADDAAERAQGLSGRAGLPDDVGMLFVYQEPVVPGFWMRQMRFPLDFVWIGEGCEVVDVTPNVPEPLPDTSDAELVVYRPAAPILYNLEVNAGTSESQGIEVGDAVRFHNVPGGACQANRR